MKLSLSLLLLAVVWIAGSTVHYEKSMVDEMRQRLLQLEKDFEKEFANPKWNAMDEATVFRYIINSYKRFGNELDEKFPSGGYENLNAINSVWLWARTESELKAIDGLYGVFRQMHREIIDQNATLNVKNIANFAETIIYDPNASIPRALERIASFIINDKLFISAYQEASTEICNELQSSQQLLYNLYTTVALTEVKGYTMIQFSYMILLMYNHGSNFSKEMDLVKQQYAMRTSESLRAVRTAMAFAPRDIWRCDPRVHKSEETYTEMKQLFQGYIVNEVDMNSESTCRENCAYYSYAKVYGCYQNQFCSQQRRCNGKLVNCEYIDSDMWICPSDKNKARRYEYIEYENGKVYGPKDVCTAGTTKVDSWWRWLFWHCSYCFCYCDDHNASSDRYFSLRTVVADVANNKVITGIRLRKVKQIIHMQIQEGVLLPRGHINSTTLVWKPIDEFSILDANVKNGVDYHTLAWERRGLDLDDLVGPENYLLTGVRFRTLGSRLNLEIRVSPFKYETGKLVKPLEKSYWHSSDVTERTELLLTEPDIPTRSMLVNVPDSKINQYLNFAPSDRVKDAAQSTVPFIDIQEIQPSPVIPIAGAGIYHKGRKGSGGFVGMKLITYNFAPHLQVDLPPPPPVIASTLNEIQN